MNRTTARLLLAAAVLVLLGVGRAFRDRQVGDLVAGGTVVPTGRTVSIAGPSVDLGATVLDCALTPDGKVAVVKTSNSIAAISVQDGKLLSKTDLPHGGSMTGIAISPDGRTVACSNADSKVWLYGLSGGELTASGSISLPAATVGGSAYPCGLRFLDAGRLAIAANRDNSVYVIGVPVDKALERIPVDDAPYAIASLDATHLLVTCWAASNRVGRPTAMSSGTPVEIDKRGIAVSGSICKVDLTTNTVVQRARLPLQPTEMAMGAGHVFVACANGDAVLELDPTTLEVQKSILLGDESGTAPDSIALDGSGNTLYVAFGGLDRIGAYDLESDAWVGLMQTGWYPSVVRWTPDRLIVATAKGVGSRSGAGPKRSVFNLTSSVSCVAGPRFSPAAPERSEPAARAGMRPVPIPARTGEPSPIKHVVYVIKENRTYDQLLGDMREGNGDPNLTIYGEKVTPNHHALAREFTLLDNYYCNGIVSSDGHAWATESNATTFYERSRGGWTRSYPFGDDPLATSSSGYIWDNALDHGRTVRNFGEFDYASTSLGAFDILNRFESKRPLSFGQKIGVARLRRVSVRDYPGWNLAIPDVLRADRFAKHLKEMERTGGMADLTIVYLPEDHTSGGSAGFPSPRAQVADNDLGLGRVVDALSHSRFWATSTVFIEEDDPQDGFDHVDGHRSICLLAGPYIRRRAVISRFYNQASVIRTIERILGLPPMNVNDAEAPLMTDCFQQKPNLSPYAAKPNQIPLDERPPQASKEAFDLSKPDQVDDELFNRKLWSLERPGKPYPKD